MKLLISLLLSIIVSFVLGCGDRSANELDSVTVVSNSDIALSEAVIEDVEYRRDTERINETEIAIETKCDPYEEENIAFYDVSIYNDILNGYKALVKFRLSDEFENIWNSEEVVFENFLSKAIVKFDKYKLSNMIVEMSIQKEYSYDTFGYAFLDINQDNIPELFWVRDDGFILAVFSCGGGETILLDAFWSRYSCVITKELNLLMLGNDGLDQEFELKALSKENNLIREGLWGAEYLTQELKMQYYEYFGNKKTLISEERYNELLEQNEFTKRGISSLTEIFYLSKKNHS